MDQTDQINLGDLQKQDRFKKLEQSLRIARLKHTINSNLESNHWPSCSSINGEQSDFNYTLSTLQFSRTGSEVLTSSRSLKNLIPRRPVSSPMATSSVKNYSENQSSNDRAIMPPPSINFIHPSSKRPAPSDLVREQVKTRRQLTRNDNFFQEKETNQEFNSSDDRLDEPGYSQDPQKGNTMDRHFYRWRVCLNNEGKLLIRGSLNNERLARSKPVVKMISSTKLESKFNHIYYLHGNIIDENRELPRYIYSKFYNGFPDDWKNVHQIWKNFVVQGSKESFRWPTDASFSDDDLNSEVSEVTDLTSLHKTKKFQDYSFLEKSTPQRSSGYSSDIHQEKDSKSSENSKSIQNWKNESLRNNSTENLNQFNEKESENANLFDVTSDRSCSGNLYAALNYAHSLKDIIFEDKLTVITQNLLHEKCPKEYVKCVNGTIENLNYLLSYKCGEFDETNKQKVESKNNYRVQELMRKCSTPLCYESDVNLETAPRNNDVEKKINVEKCEKLKFATSEGTISPVVTKTPETRLQTNSDDSENEIYAGVPKIVPGKIFQSKLDYRRSRKFDRIDKIRAQSNSKERKNNLDYDLSAGILEEGFGKRESRANRIRLDSKNVKSNISGSHIDNFADERVPNPLRDDRVPLERLAEFSDNRSPSKTSNNFPNPLNNEKRKLLTDKENREINNRDEFLQRKEFQNLQRIDSQNLQRVDSQNLQRVDSQNLHRVDSQNLQRMDTQNLHRMDSQHSQRQDPTNLQNLNSNQGNQKPRIINSERVNMIQNLKGSSKSKLSSNEENNRLDQKDEKSREVLNPEGRLSEEIQEDSNNDSFGSEKNPKLLDSWIPCVISDGKKYHLVFEGILLNAVGRAMKKKFTTNKVVRRVSSLIIETADQQFYKLVGELNNNKHVVPKELLPQCRNGCPAKIDYFCTMWLKLKGENAVVDQKATTDKKIIPVSSRGRNILPPLNFWADERIIKKDGEAVYKSGDPKEKFVTSAIGSPSKLLNSPDAITSNETVKGTLNFEEERRVAKNKVVHKLNFESSESDEEKDRHNKNPQNNVNLNEALAKNEEEFKRPNQNPRHSNASRLRKRQKIENVETYPNGVQVETKQLPKLRSAVSTIHCTYNKKAQGIDLSLSDDQMSVM